MPYITSGSRLEYLMTCLFWIHIEIVSMSWLLILQSSPHRWYSYTVRNNRWQIWVKIILWVLDGKIRRFFIKMGSDMLRVTVIFFSNRGCCHPHYWLLLLVLAASETSFRGECTFRQVFLNPANHTFSSYPDSFCYINHLAVSLSHLFQRWTHESL